MGFSLNDPFNITRPMMKRMEGTPLGDGMSALGNNKVFGFMTTGPQAMLPAGQQLQPSPWMDMKQVEEQEARQKQAALAKSYGDMAGGV